MSANSSTGNARFFASQTHTPNAPAKVSADGLEQRWNETWSQQGTYDFDRNAERHEVFSIDTPPAHCFWFTARGARLFLLPH